MYQYWFFAFKSAKHWGRGPQDWTADILGFDDYHQRTTISISSPNTPAADLGTPASQSTPQMDEMIDLTLLSVVKTPSSLCRWGIHYSDIGYTIFPSPPHSSTWNLSRNDEESRLRWPASHKSEEYTNKLCASLESNNFSNVKIDDLPIAVDHIAKAARRSPDELLDEALGFSIMSRNSDLVRDLAKRIGGRFDDIGLYPFHLAVTYLDGSKTCCEIFDILEDIHPLSLPKLYINTLGHTVLDQLMIAILKAHTSCLPNVVDVIFKTDNRFEGEDVDICGRWDADSDCIRTLLANGSSDIPYEWKHMFCHTSVRTICHCIGTVFDPYWRPDIDTPSGLFVRRCLHCGLKPQLLPLHTLVLVGLHLSRSGCKNENLFGILACLLCLLRNGANPLLKSNLSVQALMGNEEVNECSHEELDPAELAEMLLTSSQSVWSREVITGWRVICSVFKHSQRDWKATPSWHRSASNGRVLDDEFDTFTDHTEDEKSTDEEASDDHHRPAKRSKDKVHRNFFRESNVLAPLWGDVQKEFQTYRRLKEGDEWISPNFNMQTLNEVLIRDNEVDIALVQQKMMKTFCRCGQFSESNPACAIVDNSVGRILSLEFG